MNKFGYDLVISLTKSNHVADSVKEVCTDMDVVYEILLKTGIPLSVTGTYMVCVSET